MNSKRPVVLAAFGVVIGVLAWWFTQHYGFTKERVRVGYSGEARANPYFAARLLLERLGMRVQEKAQLGKAGALPEGGTVLLAAWRSELDPPAAHALLEWVKRGGHLVVGVEDELDRDALLAAVRVRAHWPRDEEGQRRQQSRPERVALPDGRTLAANLEPSPILVPADPAGIWRHDSRDGARILVIGWGSGRITLLSTLRPFGNPGIGQLDHAELLWYVVGHAKSRDLLLVRHLETASLPRWLLEHAPLALAALGVLLVLWLWRVVPRFGPLRPGAVPDRRSVLEHIRAVGGFYADQHQLAPLLEVLRADCLERFGHAAPLAAGLDGAARLREASRLTRINPRELLQAFTGSAATRHDFSSTVRTLAKFRRRLTRRPS